MIVCHEKVVRIPLEGDEIRRVHSERTQGVVKTLMNTKSKEEHEVHLKLVLGSLRKEKLYAKFSKLGDALSRKERVKSRRVRGMILVAQIEAFKQENILAERLHGLDQQMERKGDESLYFMDQIWVLLVGSVMDEAHASSKEWNSSDDQLRLRWMIYLLVLADAAESVKDAIGLDYHSSIRCAPFEALYGRKYRSLVLWGEIGEGSLIRPELVLETTDKVVLIKEKLKAARDRQKSYADKRCKPLEFEVGPFEILERIGLVAYRLRLPEELNSVHDTFHVSNLKKCLVNANLHVSLDEIKVDKTLRFVEEPVEIMDREIKKLKRRKIALVKVRWSSKRGPEFTWEYEDEMRIKYPQLFLELLSLLVKSQDEISSRRGYCDIRDLIRLEIRGLLAGIYGLFSGRNCCLVRRITCGYPWPELEEKRFGMIQERLRSSAWCLND
ncbi:hypothetical protein Tco_0906431 [Tanacetum coccineum]|uniref:Tf2-1-like SH3-like domain-containing protein n=1 Tax=Tanacetum coccineum TaxID=301880 RepID=A0ABQ5CGG9_9ASTR